MANEMDKPTSKFSLLSSCEEVVSDRYNAILARIIGLEEREEKRTRHLEAVVSAICQFGSCNQHRHHQHEDENDSEDALSTSSFQGRITRRSDERCRCSEETQVVHCTAFVRTLIVKVEQLEERLSHETQEREALQQSMQRLKLQLKQQSEERHALNRYADAVSERAEGTETESVELRIRSIVDASMSEWCEDVLLDVKSLIENKEGGDGGGAAAQKQQQQQEGPHSLSFSSMHGPTLMGSGCSSPNGSYVAAAPLGQRLEPLAQRRVTHVEPNDDFLLGQKDSFSEASSRQKRLPPLRTKALSSSQTGGILVRSPNKLCHPTNGSFCSSGLEGTISALGVSFSPLPCKVIQKPAHESQSAHENIFVVPHRAKGRDENCAEKKGVVCRSSLRMPSRLGGRPSGPLLSRTTPMGPCSTNSSNSNDNNKRKDGTDVSHALGGSAVAKFPVEEEAANGESVRVDVEPPLTLAGAVNDDKQRERPPPLDKETLENTQKEVLQLQVAQIHMYLEQGGEKAAEEEQHVKDLTHAVIPTSSVPKAPDLPVMLSKAQPPASQQSSDLVPAPPNALPQKRTTACRTVS